MTTSSVLLVEFGAKVVQHVSTLSFQMAELIHRANVGQRSR